MPTEMACNHGQSRSTDPSIRGSGTGHSSGFMVHLWPSISRGDGDCLYRMYPMYTYIDSG